MHLLFLHFYFFAQVEGPNDSSLGLFSQKLLAGEAVVAKLCAVASAQHIFAFCGILLLLVKRYLSGKLAVSVYAASSFLLLLLPDRMTAAAYILLFGYYPILRDAMLRLPLLLRTVLKLALLTAVGCAALFGAAALMGLWSNPKFMEYCPALIAVYYAMVILFDLFLMLLTHRLQTRWDAKLKNLFR